MKKALILICAFAASTSMAIAQVPTATGPAGVKFITQKDTGMLSTNAVGTDVYNPQKEDVGKIKDVSITSGTVDGYVVSVGGFLGMGTRYVIVSPDSLKVNYDATDKKWHATVNATKDELKNAPEFQYNGKWNASQN